MAFSRAGKQAMIFTTEQSQSSTSIRMACQLVLNSSSTGVSSQKGGTVEILVCLGSISESCMHLSVRYCTSLLHTKDFEQMNPTLALLCLCFGGLSVGDFSVDFNFYFLFKFKQHRQLNKMLGLRPCKQKEKTVTLPGKRPRRQSVETTRTR